MKKCKNYIMVPDLNSFCVLGYGYENPASITKCRGNYQYCNKISRPDIKKEIAYAFTDELKSKIPQSLLERDNVINILGDYFGMNGVSKLLKRSREPDFPGGTSALYKEIYDALREAFPINDTLSAFAIKMDQGQLSHRISKIIEEWKPVFEILEPNP